MSKLYYLLTSTRAGKSYPVTTSRYDFELISAKNIVILLLIAVYPTPAGIGKKENYSEIYCH